MEKTNGGFMVFAATSVESSDVVCVISHLPWTRMRLAELTPNLFAEEGASPLGCYQLYDEDEKLWIHLTNDAPIPNRATVRFTPLQRSQPQSRLILTIPARSASSLTRGPSARVPANIDLPAAPNATLPLAEQDELNPLDFAANREYIHSTPKRTHHCETSPETDVQLPQQSVAALDFLRTQSAARKGPPDHRCHGATADDASDQGRHFTGKTSVFRTKSKNMEHLPFFDTLPRGSAFDHVGRDSFHLNEFTSSGLQAHADDRIQLRAIPNYHAPFDNSPRWIERNSQPCGNVPYTCINAHQRLGQLYHEFTLGGPETTTPKNSHKKTLDDDAKAKIRAMGKSCWSDYINKMENACKDSSDPNLHLKIKDEARAYFRQHPDFSAMISKDFADYDQQALQKYIVQLTRGYAWYLIPSNREKKQKSSKVRRTSAQKPGRNTELFEDAHFSTDDH